MIKNSPYKVLSVVCFLFVLSFYVSPAFSESYAVVVNASNNYSADASVMKNQVKQLFLKQTSSWPNGKKVNAFDRGKGSTETSAFNKNILKMDSAAVARHWLGLKQKTGETPPRNVKSTNMLLKLIAKYEGGLGIVDSETAKKLPEGVKVLFKF